MKHHISKKRQPKFLPGFVCTTHFNAFKPWDRTSADILFFLSFFLYFETWHFIFLLNSTCSFLHDCIMLPLNCIWLTFCIDQVCAWRATPWPALFLYFARLLRVSFCFVLSCEQPVVFLLAYRPEFYVCPGFDVTQVVQFFICSPNNNVGMLCKTWIKTEHNDLKIL